MVILLPRLPTPAAETLLALHMADGFATWSGFDARALPEAVRFAATGGSQVRPNQLAELRDRMVRIARSNGMGDASVRATHAAFDAEVAASLADEPLFQSGEALRDDVWTFVGTSLAPDVVHWRFGAARGRYLGGVRNTFQRLWMRGRALDRGDGRPERWALLGELTEDALVQITERPSLGGDSVLARAIAEAWLRASRRHGRTAMEPIMRRAALRVRIWNETRSLADLPSEILEGVLDDAFDLPRESDDADPGPAGRRVGSADAEGLRGSAGSESESQAAQSPAELSEVGDPVALAATRVRAEARKRGWISPKSSKALESLVEGQGELKSSERNALDFLLERMRSASVLHDDVAQLGRAVASREGHVAVS